MPGIYGSELVSKFGSAYGNRTRLSALRGPCPKPIDERAARSPGNVNRWVVVVNARQSSGPLQQSLAPSRNWVHAGLCLLCFLLHNDSDVPAACAPQSQE